MSTSVQKRSFENGVQFAWDATSLDLAQTCLRKYYYKIIRGIAPKDTSVHLVFGGIYASCLEHFYKYRAQGDSIENAQRSIVREALVESWEHQLDEDGKRIPDTGRPRTFEHTAKTRPNLIRTIVWYIEQFAVEKDQAFSTYHLSDGKPAVELSFALELSSDIIYCGHLDRVVEMAGELYVMDQKTTGGTVGTYYFDYFKPNNQMSGYSMAGQAVLHSPVRGVVIDAAQIAVNFTRFERGITTRSKDEIEEWLNNTIRLIRSYQEFTRQAGDEAEKWPMNPNSCGNYGGCEFRILCQRSPKVRENFIKSDFVDHNWDPVEER